MNPSTKQKILKSVKIGWLLVGVLMILNVGFWWIKMITSTNIAVLIILSVFLGYSVIALIIFFGITFIYFIIKLMSKLVKK